MVKERRGSPRLRVNMDTYLESGTERHRAVILDLSHKGCFVLTPKQLSTSAPVRVEVGKPGLLHMTLDGAVARSVSGKGLGIRFKDVTATQRTLLTKLLQSIVQQGLK